MIEIHPFESFVPKNTEYLILGSFIGKRSENDIQNGFDWFYGTKRNMFWPILREVYGMKLVTKSQKQELFSRLGIAITDIIFSCRRAVNNNSDSNLKVITINMAISKIIKENKISKIYFSSKFAKNLFQKYFFELISEYPKIELITLPSPSPRFAMMKKDEKVICYKELLPKF